MLKTLVKNEIPKIGELAPDFEAYDQDGYKVSLKEFRDKILILCFYPQDSISFIKEVCSLRDRYSTFRKKNIVVLGIIKESQKSLCILIEKHDLPFTLISDADKKMQLAYGVRQEKIIYGRKTMITIKKTFIIGPDQKIKYVFNDADHENYAEEILEILEELNSI